MVENNTLTIGDWFRCPRCCEESDGKLNVTFALGLKNLSLKIKCRLCGFRHKEYDIKSDNWNKIITWKLLLFSSNNLTYPISSSKLHYISKCGNCSSRTVQIEMETVEKYPSNIDDDSLEGKLKFNCMTCEKEHIYTISHN